MPLTTHTSPFHVQTAADLPSAKKSNPPGRIHADHGFSSGSVSVSTTYAGSGFFASIVGLTASAPFVSIACFQRPGPPLVSSIGSRGGGTASTAATPPSATVNTFACCAVGGTVIRK